MPGWHSLKYIVSNVSWFSSCFHHPQTVSTHFHLILLVHSLRMFVGMKALGIESVSGADGCLVVWKIAENQISRQKGLVIIGGAAPFIVISDNDIQMILVS